MKLSEEYLTSQWHKLCREIAIYAKSKGVKDPFLYANEAGLSVYDGQPISHVDVIFTLPKPPIYVITYGSGGT